MQNSPQLKVSCKTLQLFTIVANDFGRNIFYITYLSSFNMEFVSGYYPVLYANEEIEWQEQFSVVQFSLYNYLQMEECRHI